MCQTAERRFGRLSFLLASLTLSHLPVAFRALPLRNSSDSFAKFVAIRRVSIFDFLCAERAVTI
jgi:hypothetical protein